MSDTNIAPPAPASAPSAPAAPAPAPNEVVIDQNPTASPQPVGPQAPEKPPGESRREAIRKAFDRAREPDRKPDREPDREPGREPSPKTKARGMGDNNPPEAMEKEKATPDQRGERYREKGRFAKAPDQAGVETAPGQPPQAGEDRKPAAPLPENAPYREPPPRFSERGKQEWSTAPESVRGEVYRMAKEFEGAYRQYRGDHEEMNSIRHFHQMAGEHGTTLARALNNYVSMEQKLRTDVIGGLDVIINNLNLRTTDGQKLNLRDIAYHVLNQSPDQHKMIQQSNAQQAAQHQIGALHQEVTGLKNVISQMHNQQVFGHTRSGVDQFADTHPRFDELGSAILQEVELGFDLETAYQRADRLYPSSRHAAQTRNTPAQTRSDKSIHGAPDSGASNAPARRDGKPIGRREAISNAIKRVNGGV